jgi:UDP-N-acetylglucosamine transferase subunit ALG13
VIDDAVAEKRITYPVLSKPVTRITNLSIINGKIFVTFREVERNIRESNICVLHAGVGPTLLSLSLGVVPIIFPRKFDLGEHLGDHQIEFSNKFNEMKKCLVAYDENELIYMINHYDEVVK